MAIWKCDECGYQFEDAADHEGDTCNECDDGSLSEAIDEYDYSAGEFPEEGEDGFESELNRGYQELDENGKRIRGE